MSSPQVDYVVRPLPAVTELLASADRAIQDEFQLILSVVAINPFPNPQFPLLTEERAENGTRLFTYSDDIFPYAIHFVVFDSDEDNYGMIVVVHLSLLSP